MALYRKIASILCAAGALLSALFCLTLPFFTSCAAADKPLAVDASATFSLIVPAVSPGSADLVCDAVWAGGDLTLTLCAPSALAGVTVVCTEAGCVIRAGDRAIPLTDAAAASLVGIRTVFCEAMGDGVTRTRSNDGLYTLLHCPSGLVSFSVDGCPTAIECAGRVLTIADWCAQGETTAET